MTTYVLRNGELVEKAKAPPRPGVMVMGDLKPYKSPLGNGWVDGRRARREELARSGCREVDPSEYKPQYQNQRFAERHGLPYTPGNEAHYRGDRPRDPQLAGLSPRDYDLSHLKR